MTNTYPDDVPINEKAKEELRLIRCLLERLLRVVSESNFVDYQMEKFGKRFDIKTHEKGEASILEQIKYGDVKIED